MIRTISETFISDKNIASIRLLRRFKSELEKLPAGSLRKKKIRGKYRYYRYLPSGIPGIRGKESYIGKDGQVLIRQLTRRRFIEKSIPVLEKVIKNQKRYLKDDLVFDPTEVARSLPGSYRDLDYSPILDSTEQNHPSVWSNEPYERSSLYPEKLIYTTVNGLHVRSKSESIIAGFLEAADIPFRYEALLVLDGHNYYPDFTILNPQDNQIIYWEHFGMVDDEIYLESMKKKLDAYKRHGIQPWNNLITTYETRTNPFNAQQIGRIVKAFLTAE